MPTRVAVFVDYTNCYRRAREAFCSGSRNHVDGQVDPLRLAELLSGERELAAVRVYRGMPSNARDPKAYAATRRQIAAWDRTNLVTPVTRPLNYRVPTAPKEKGIDVRLAVDMVVMAMLRHYDIAVLVSEDTDLLPAVEAVVALKGGQGVEFTTWVPTDGSRPRALKVAGLRLVVHRLGGTEYSVIHDRTDYTEA